MDQVNEHRPYVGLRPYSCEDKAIFFGRDREARDVSTIAIAHRATLLFGRSGVGKTSLVHAAVADELEREGFDVRFLPVVSQQDFSHLLASDEKPVLAVFDQLEEVLQGNFDERERFFHNMSEVLDVTPALHLLLCIREEYLGPIDRYADWFPGELRNRFRLEPLSASAARQAIVGPLRALGGLFLADAAADRLVPPTTIVRRNCRTPNSANGVL